MNRRLFLKRFGIGAAAIVAVPMVLSKEGDDIYHRYISRIEYDGETQVVYYDPYVYSMKEQAFIKLSHLNR